MNKLIKQPNQLVQKATRPQAKSKSWKEVSLAYYCENT